MLNFFFMAADLNFPVYLNGPIRTMIKRPHNDFAVKGNWRLFFCLSILALVFSVTTARGQEVISFGTLIDEMTDLNRLTELPEQTYRMVQYSSYDRRSKVPGMRGWFANSDGFGGEPIPGFEAVVSPPEPDGSALGTYLICDVEGPGAILRLWTAGINGNISLFLDNSEEPLYEGNAEEFFWNTAARISGVEGEHTDPGMYRQFDATYFPVPFSTRCRIEWIGDIKKIHFYHVGIRLYERDVKVQTFKPGNVDEHREQLLQLKDRLYGVDQNTNLEAEDVDPGEITIPGGESADILKIDSGGAIDLFSIKLEAEDPERMLRSCILSIYFDGADVPQVEAPLGDFFGAAPGLNPYVSYPFAVQPDGAMICRFFMPFQQSVRMVVQNTSEETADISVNAHLQEYNWIEGKSMHFRARWKIDHGLTASNSSIEDIPYFLARGEGRIVGSAAYIYNPSEAVVSWGNWWGEGDEKIFMDDQAFPSFFGTGSEDYFNYSWSAERYFSYPYCGQPRNDGPGNRGYVSNFRWHISDDLPFQKNIAFYMELYHHGVVPGFSYGRIVYAYTLPGCVDDYVPITARDVEEIPYNTWEPLAYLGSRGYEFRQSEEMVVDPAAAGTRKGKLWSDNHILEWKPEESGDSLRFTFAGSGESESTIAMTLAHGPDGGTFSVLLNGEPVRFSDKELINTHDPSRTYLRNHFSEKIRLKERENEIVLVNNGPGPEESIKIDFFWFKDHKL